MRARIPIVLAAFAVLAPSFPHARAEEPPAPKAPAPLEQDLAAAKALLKDGKWKPAREAFLKLFADRPRDAELQRRLPDIEEDLKLASFRAQEPEPTAEALFGKGTVKYSHSSRRLSLSYPGGAKGEPWGTSKEGVSALPIRFEQATLEFETGDAAFTVLLCYDPDGPSAYRVGVNEPARRGRETQFEYWNSEIERLDGGKSTSLETDFKSKFLMGPMGKVKVSHVAGKLTLAVPKLSTISASDIRLKSGFLAIAGSRVTGLAIEGVVEKMHAQALVAAHYERRFREWSAASWRREEVLPPWATTAPAVTEPAIRAAPLPADAPDPVPAAVLRALEHWSRGELKEFVKALPAPDDLRAATRHYLLGLRALGEGRLAEAEDLFSGVVEREPAFAPALVYRGFARLRRRDVPGARGDFEKASGTGASVPDVWIGLAHLAILDGDLDRADRHLADARARGMASPVLDRLTTRVLRSRRGPTWAKRFTVKGPAALVVTDHSQDMAQQVSRVVEGVLSLGTAVFPDTVRATAPVRVHVFSSRDGFAAYCSELGNPATNAVGIYFSMVRELVFYVPPVSREEFWNTARHEAFHAFLHASLEEAPFWLNEGWAECFAYGKAVAGGIDISPLRSAPSSEDGDVVVNAAEIEELMVMDPEAFMARAERNYGVSRRLVHFLYDGENRKFRPTLLDYFRSLRAGSSHRAAFDKHWRPVLEDVSRGFRAW